VRTAPCHSRERTRAGMRTEMQACAICLNGCVRRVTLFVAECGHEMRYHCATVRRRSARSLWKGVLFVLLRLDRFTFGADFRGGVYVLCHFRQVA
jgi:hypothetical protein